MEEKGIKEISELLEGLKLLVVDGKAIAADGKISVDDIKPAIDLLSNINVLVEAVKGADGIPSELKDLSMEELQVLGAKAFEIVAAIKAS